MTGENSYGATGSESAKEASPGRSGVHRRLADAAARSGMQGIHKVQKAYTLANNSAGRVPLYAVSPGLELLHKALTAVLAVAFVIGLYSAGNSLIAVPSQAEVGAAAAPSQNSYPAPDISSAMSTAAEASTTIDTASTTP